MGDSRKDGEHPIKGCCGEASDCSSVGRRDFVKLVGLGTAASAVAQGSVFASPGQSAVGATSAGQAAGAAWNEAGGWPSFVQYSGSQLGRIALPLGGIGTGTVSLGGRGDLRDWELMNRPAKGFTPSTADIQPCLLLFCRQADGRTETRLLEGPIEPHEYEGSHGSPAAADNLPRFRDARFDAAYPFGRVRLGDPAIPLEVEIRAFNPLIPGDPDDSALPAAILTIHLTSRATSDLEAAVCFSLPNFVGMDGWDLRRDWKGDQQPVGPSGNRNEYRQTAEAKGIFCWSDGVDPAAPAWGTLALLTTATQGVSWRTDWDRRQWGNAWLDFWDDFSADGKVEERRLDNSQEPIGSLAVSVGLAPGEAKEVTFILSWHFPNRYSWTSRAEPAGPEDRIGNHYTTRFQDAWEAASQVARDLPRLYQSTSRFARSLYGCDLPAPIREAAGFTLTALRSQTSFRTPDGLFFGYEGCGDHKGCCHGSCTHVWNYEQATAFLYGSLSRSMREVEFLHATDERGLMSFRVNLPLDRAREFGKAAADGQLGCIMKVYRDWQLSGDSGFLSRLWPKVHKALEFCWIPGGWDADRDGVMEGCQHNTMDVEYYGPNPQMEFWYLGALRATAEMARAMGDEDFAGLCSDLFRRGRAWTEANLFTGEYYRHLVQAPANRSAVAPELLIGMGAADPTRPEFQLADGCLVDQLVGQFMAHVCGLGHLADPDQIRKTLTSILRYNRQDSLNRHFTPTRTYALGDERGLLMAAYPGDRPENPFPYFAELMTGFEYTAGVGMLFEGMRQPGLEVIADVRSRYDGRRRSPFDEAECGHHYARAMAVWAAIPAWTGFAYTGLTRTLEIGGAPGNWFWSNGSAWGTIEVALRGSSCRVTLRVDGGTLALDRLSVKGVGETVPDPPVELNGPAIRTFEIAAKAESE